MWYVLWIKSREQAQCHRGAVAERRYKAYKRYKAYYRAYYKAYRRFKAQRRYKAHCRQLNTPLTLMHSLMTHGIERWIE